MGIDWSGTEIWFSDERCVPPDNEHSNFRMAQESLLSEIAPAAVHRMQGERGPDDGAREYEQELAAVFGDGTVPEFDLILLGIGPDAHCASLFPNNPELGIKDRTVAGVEQPGMAPLVPRITLTLPLLNAGARVVFLVSGEEKAEAVARAFNGRPGPDAPSSLVQPRGELLLLCDPEAAKHI
jgi:6-phosphogluconolactonase